MKITYKDLTDDLAEVVKAQEKDPLERYSVDIEGTMKSMPATRVLTVIDTASSFEERAQVVKELLQGCKVTIYKDGKETFDVAMNNGVEWWAIDGFNADPMALRYLVTVVYTRFLKKYTA
jgi:hypothetical protein